MWVSKREEGLDDPRHTKRGPSVDLTLLLGNLLRVGFSIQLLSLTLMYFSFWLNGGFGLFNYDLSGISEEGRGNSNFRNSLALFSGMYLVGSIYIMSFQCLLADDSCWARGYRSGSKILGIASFLDVLSSLFQFMFYLYIAKFYSLKWFSYFSEGGSEWIYLVFTRVLHSIAFIMYATATYLLEIYHDEGAGDLHAYINGSFFFITGLSEIVVLFFRSSSLSTALIWLTLVVIAVWAYFFEPEVNLISPALYETELTNDIEQQVEMFANRNPYMLQENQEYQTND